MRRNRNAWILNIFLTLALLMTVWPLTPVQSADPLSDRITKYDISVRLDPENKMLHGTEWVTWTNPGEQAVGEVYFHLYPNAFRSKQSTFIRESGGKLRRDQMTLDSNGSMELEQIVVYKGEDITDTLRYIQPDDQNEHDRTVATVTLPEPVEPGESVTLQIEFKVKLPKVFARMGYYGDFVMAGQWFPKVAVYEPVGRRGAVKEGWNAHQYHGNSEFYADFGTYQVAICVPKNYEVAATGDQIGKRVLEQDGTATWKFAATDVHDFSWSASPDFIYAEKSFSSQNVPGVKIKLYLDPVHKHLKDRYFKAAIVSLELFSKWYGSYPYSTLSIVVPPNGAGGAAGMEYPTLITAWDAKDATPGPSLERVVVHEIGHQYFYGMVASNEFEEAWLDEGFTSYAEDKVMENAYKAPGYLPFESITITNPEPLVRNAWDYDGYMSYASNVYTRGKLVLFAIEAQIGEQKMQSVLKAYFDRWKFDHPSTHDFQKVLEEETGRDWTAFFNTYVYGGLMVDYAVKDVEVRPVAQDGKQQFESIVTMEQRGGFYPTVPIQIGFADGSTYLKEWSGNQQNVRFRIVKSSPVSWVHIDPNLTVLLENKRLNNFIRAEIDPVQQQKWSSYGLNLLHLLFQWIGW